MVVASCVIMAFCSFASLVGGTCGPSPEVKRCIVVFCEFLDDVRFLENQNNIFEENSLKAFLRQSFRVFDFSNLSSDSLYLEVVTLNNFEV